MKKLILIIVFLFSIPLAFAGTQNYHWNKTVINLNCDNADGATTNNVTDGVNPYTSGTVTIDTDNVVGSGACDFTAGGSLIWNASPAFQSPNLTSEMWFKYEDTSAIYPIYYGDGTTDEEGEWYNLVYTQSPDKWKFVNHDGISVPEPEDNPTKANDGAYGHLVTVRNVTGGGTWIYMYLNGTEVVSQLLAGDIDAPVLDAFTMSGIPGALDADIGHVDEFNIYNFSMTGGTDNTDTSTDIGYRFDLGSGRPNEPEVVPDTLPPIFSTTSINKTSPEENEVIQIGNNVSDDTSLSMIIFAWNNSGTWTNYSNSSVLASPTLFSNYTVNVTINASTFDVIGVQFFANDTKNNWNSSSISTFVITDTTIPTISIEYPTNNSGINPILYDTNINGTVYDSVGIENISINDTRFSSYLNWTATTNTKVFFNFTNNSNLPDDNYVFNITVNDTSGNQNSTVWYYTLDTTNVIGTTNLTNGSTYEGNQTFHFTTTDDNNYNNTLKVYNGSETIFETHNSSVEDNELKIIYNANFSLLGSGSYSANWSYWDRHTDNERPDLDVSYSSGTLTFSKNTDPTRKLDLDFGYKVGAGEIQKITSTIIQNYNLQRILINQSDRINFGFEADTPSASDVKFGFKFDKFNGLSLIDENENILFHIYNRYWLDFKTYIINVQTGQKYELSGTLIERAAFYGVVYNLNFADYGLSAGDRFQFITESIGALNRIERHYNITVENRGLKVYTTLVTDSYYYDQDEDGTNYGETSEGWTAGEEKTKMISARNISNMQYLIIRSSEVNGALDYSINGNLIGNTPAYASGTGTYSYSVFNISASKLNSNNSHFLNISAGSGNSATVYIDWFALVDTRNITFIANDSRVFAFFNYSLSGEHTMETLNFTITKDQDGSITESNDVINISCGGSDCGFGEHIMYHYIPTDYDHNFTLEPHIVTTERNSRTGSNNNIQNYTITVDSTDPSFSYITTDLNAIAYQDIATYLNYTEPHIAHVRIAVDSVNQTMSLSDGNYTTNITYQNGSNHSLVFWIVDHVGHHAKYEISSSSSVIIPSFSAQHYTNVYSSTNYINVTDTVAYTDQSFKIDINLTSNGTAYIDDYNMSINISHSQVPNNTQIWVKDGRLLNYSKEVYNVSYIVDPFNNTNQSSINNTQDYLLFTVEEAILTEWENTGVEDTRLFYIKDYNTTFSFTDVWLNILMRSSYYGSADSITFKECTGTINWAAKTCSQWTSRTSDLYNEGTNTWNGGSFPTVDSSGDGQKDALRIKVSSLSEHMYQMDLLSGTAEPTWSGGGSGGGTGGGDAGGSDDDEEIKTKNETIVVASSTAQEEEKSRGLGSITGAVIGWVGDVFSGITSQLTRINFKDPTTLMLIFVIIIIIAGTMALSIGSKKGQPTLI